MAVNYEKVNDEILRVARGLGYEVEMFDELGAGPISSALNAKYLYLKPDGIMISLPLGGLGEHDEVFVNTGNKKDVDKFVNLLRNIRATARFNALGVTVRKFETDKITPKDFADEAKARLEASRK